MEKKEVCPICAKAILPIGEAGRGRFCSLRCRQIDLGKWLDGAYRMPVSDADNDSEGPAESGVDRTDGAGGDGDDGGNGDGGGDAA